MARWYASRRLLGPAVFVALVALCTGSYIITTPRKWTTGELVQVCLFSVGGGEVDGAAPVEMVEVRVEGSSGTPKDLIPSRVISIPPGKTEGCESIAVPALEHRSGKLHISGIIGAKTVDHNETIHFATRVSETFVQTDKFLYKAGQKVQFRILTIKGPYLKIFTGVYPEMWIESPSGSRIAQWINVDSPAGLIHKHFQLIDEPEEGTYKIHVESPVGGGKAVQTFKVEEFVLPRFEVTMESPPFILGSDNTLKYKVCATYTYGQPVKGNVTFTLKLKDYSNTQDVLTEQQISGCREFTFDESKVQLNRDNFLASSVGAVATVVEEGTGQVATQQSNIDVKRTALKFKFIGTEDYVKPNLPFTGQIKVTLPSGAPAANKVMKVCPQRKDCKNFTTDASGVVKFIFPKHEDFGIQVTSPDYPRVENPDKAWRPIMFESSFYHNVKKYHSPSNSSVTINTPEIRLRCRAGERQEFSVSVMYAGTANTKANFTIQLVSRGQIQYSHTEEKTLTETDLPIDASLLLLPLPPPSNGTVRGATTLPLTVPLTASPTAKVMVWYTRQDGEVVSDMQEIQIKKCLTHQVGLKWSNEKAAPGDDVHLEITAAPNSFCSLGVVDKSVELLSSGEDSLTLDGVFEVAERAMIGDSENTQIDDSEYCRGKNPKDEEDIPFPPFIPRPPGVPVPFAEPPLRIAKRSIWRPRGSYRTTEVDAIKMFDKSGLFVFTDLKVETRPCHYQGFRFLWRTDVPLPTHRPLELRRIPYARRKSSFVMYGTPTEPKIRKMEYAPPPMEIMVEEEGIRMEEGKTSVIESTVRSYFPATFLWQLHSVRYGNLGCFCNLACVLVASWQSCLF